MSKARRLSKAKRLIENLRNDSLERKVSLDGFLGGFLRLAVETVVGHIAVDSYGVIGLEVSHSVLRV